MASNGLRVNFLDFELERVTVREDLSVILLTRWVIM